ncbi:hypothetical protein GCM10010411_74980 [Actinomadura fulvescens]|uniref:Uncharacterized protein n=1 Tax=Actinomadura fulvescens TaxID=46160 RepID=A0ABP6CVC8_9ACTN
MPSAPNAAAPPRREAARFTADELADPLAFLEGLPFLSEDFRARRLLAGVAAVRHREAQQAGKAGVTPEAWLSPSAIYMLRDSPSMPAEPLTPTRRAVIDAQLAEAGQLMPEWAYLLSLPVRYARLYPDRGAISASSRAWQQHVLLADAAFASDAELAEQLHHELAHQWFYLLQELWPLEEEGAPGITLPSGTSGRSPAEVLGAVHVAAVLIRRYDTVGGASLDRLESLAAYGTACLDRVDHLTPVGEQIAKHLARSLY